MTIRSHLAIVSPRLRVKDFVRFSSKSLKKNLFRFKLFESTLEFQIKSS